MENMNLEYLLGIKNINKKQAKILTKYIGHLEKDILELNMNGMTGNSLYHDIGRCPYLFFGTEKQEELLSKEKQAKKLIEYKTFFKEYVSKLKLNKKLDNEEYNKINWYLLSLFDGEKSIGENQKINENGKIIKSDIRLTKKGEEITTDIAIISILYLIKFINQKYYWVKSYNIEKDIFNELFLCMKENTKRYNLSLKSSFIGFITPYLESCVKKFVSGERNDINNLQIDPIPDGDDSSILDRMPDRYEGPLVRLLKRGNKEFIRKKIEGMSKEISKEVLVSYFIRAKDIDEISIEFDLTKRRIRTIIREFIIIMKREYSTIGKLNEELYLGFPSSGFKYF